MNRHNSWLFEAPLQLVEPTLQALNSETKGAWLFEAPDPMASHKANKSRVRWDKHTKKRPGAPEKGDARRTHGTLQPSEARKQAIEKVEQAQQTLTSLHIRRHKALLAGQSFDVGQIDKAIDKTKKILNYWRQFTANQEA